MKKMYLLLVGIALQTVGFGQDLNLDGQLLHQQNEPSASAKAGKYAPVSGQVNRFSVYHINADRFFGVMIPGNAIHHVAVNLGEYQWELTLWKTDMRSDNYVMRSGDGQHFMTHPRTESSQYKGYVNGNPKHTVRMNIRNNHIEGVIRVDGQMYSLQTMSVFDPANLSNDLVVYNVSDIIPTKGVSCGNVSSALGKFDLEDAEVNITSSPRAYKCVEIALACDYSFRTKAGGTTQAETRLLDILSYVQGYYDSHEIEYKVVETYISTNSSNNTWGNHGDA